MEISAHRNVEIVTIKRTADTQMGRVLLVVMLGFVVTYVKQVSVLKNDNPLKSKNQIHTIFSVYPCLCYLDCKRFAFSSPFEG